jgi:ADP-ribosyl-[dinitrogen reductase] hydrolase
MKIVATFLGLSIGDALGVPVEFMSRERIAQNPVTTMRGFGTHRQPIGTWSDDSSLAFCLAESLCKGYDLNDIAKQFVGWYQKNYWTPHGKVFDIGIATAQAIQNVIHGVSPLLSGGNDEYSNGNGSLMRIMPIVFYIDNQPIAKRFEIVANVSSITHRHIRSILACFIYTEYALNLIHGLDKIAAYKAMQITVNDFIKNKKIFKIEEINYFHRVLNNDIATYSEDTIQSSGYVVHTLEASLWCFLNTDSFEKSVLKAVNLGSDTDTTGCVTGGLAGLHYGLEAIPKDWIAVLVKKDAIISLANRVQMLFQNLFGLAILTYQLWMF